ncbi:MAG TPA: hypothetical protein PLP19_22470 [bacterium]|nr:hypothetical protein [bacterium]
MLKEFKILACGICLILSSCATFTPPKAVDINCQFALDYSNGACDTLILKTIAPVVTGKVVIDTTLHIPVPVDTFEVIYPIERDTVTVRDTLAVHDTVTVIHAYAVHDTTTIIDTLLVTIHDTTVVHDTVTVIPPPPVFPQLWSRTSYTLSWQAARDSTMGIFILYHPDEFGLPKYEIKRIPYPDSTCVIRSEELRLVAPWERVTMYMIAEDNAGNTSTPSDTVAAVFGKSVGVWGDVAGAAGEFDAADYAVMQYLIFINRYEAGFDFNCDGELTDDDLVFVVTE